MVTASGSEVQQAGVAGLARVQAFLSVLSQRRVRIGNLSRFGDGHGFRSFTEAIAKTAHPKIKAPPTHIPKSGDYDKSRPNFLLLAR